MYLAIGLAEDLKNIREYIAEDNGEMAENVIQEKYARIENMQQFRIWERILLKESAFARITNMWFAEIMLCYIRLEKSMWKLSVYKQSQNPGKSADTLEVAVLVQSVC